MNEPPVERRKDHVAFRKLLDRTNAQVGLLDAIDQGYREFTNDNRRAYEHFIERIERRLNRALIGMAVIGVVSVAALCLSAWQVHTVAQTSVANRALISRECRDVETLKTAIRDTLRQFVPRERRSQHRFARHRCPHSRVR
jgi:hypothetical protein